MGRPSQDHERKVGASGQVDLGRQLYSIRCPSVDKTLSVRFHLLRTMDLCGRVRRPDQHKGCDISGTQRHEIERRYT
jgi:hypothetical protein